MPLRILYIVPPTGKFAGIERVIDEVASGMATHHAAAVDVTVVHLSRYPGMTVSERPYRSFQENVSGKPELFRVIRRHVAAQPFDLVVVPQVEPAVICWAAAIGLGRRFVVHLHGNPAIERGHFRARVLFDLMKTVAKGAFVGVLGTSPRQLDAFRAMMSLPVPHIWAPNPVRRFTDGDPRPARDGLVRFVNVGRFTHQKGQDLLIEAFAVLRSTHPQARLTLVGYGDLEADLRSRVDRHGLADVVSFLHRPDDPVGALVSSDAYVSASRWEGWGLTICEALRCGLPVLATDCDFGPSDILVDPRLGSLVPAGDPEALIAGLAACCDRIDEERRHAAFRRNHIARYDLEAVVGEHVKALEAIAGGGLPTV